VKIEFDLPDEELRTMIETCVHDYVYDNRMVSGLCRQAIYNLIAEATQRVVNESPEKLRELVMQELGEVLAERPGF